MPSDRRSRRQRLLVSLSLAMVFLAGCPGPTTPQGTGKKGGTSNAGASGGSIDGRGAASPDGSGGASTPVTTNGVVASATPGPTEIAMAAAGIDAQKFLLGRVFVPLGIVSNNGGSVIGQNGANVIGQNGANIISNNGANVIGQNGANVIGQNGANVIGQNGASVIGQNGANVIGQNGANVIGQNGANIVSNNGGSIVSNNGGSIISNNGGSLGQRPLAYASLRVVDAAGNPKLGKDGKPLVGTADAWGQFLIPREAIDANSLIKVTSPYITGELTAFVAKGAETPEKELAVDAVSTLSATYIMEKYVEGKQDVLEKLTPAIEAEARQDLVAALAGAGKIDLKTTAAETVVASVEGLIGKVADVKDVFERIEKLLIVAGIVNDGDGMPALQVPIQQVDGILATEDGVYLFGASERRIRLIDNEGILRNVIEPGSWPYQYNEPRILDSVNPGIAMYNTSYAAWSDRLTG